MIERAGMMEQAPGFYRRQVGDRVVTVLNDGYLDAPLEVMPNIAPDEARALLEARFRGPAPRLMVNAFLVQGAGQTVLIDTGSGTGFGPSCGRLMANLAAAGVKPEEIDLVLLTHLHGDHFGGLATAAGEAVFPNADLAFPADDAAYWLDESRAATAPEQLQANSKAARAAVAPYATRSRGMTGPEAAPGITLVPLPGHSPGHSGFQLGEGADALLIWGDIMHVPDIQSVRPDVVVGFDLDPVQAVASRRAILERAAAERFAVAGMHLHFPGFSHVARRGDGFELVPEQWVPIV